jgi:F-type H+-transporting ATPase subunit epsilon
MAGELPTKLMLTLVTRERKLIEEEVDEVVLPGLNGAIGVLPGHTPLLAELKIGEAHYRVGDKVSRGVLSWGFAEVLPDRVIVIAEGAIRADEMDVESIENWKNEQERLHSDLSSHDEGFARAEAKIEGSLSGVRLH